MAGGHDGRWRIAGVLAVGAAALLMVGGGTGCASLPRPPQGMDLGPVVSRIETVDGHDRIRLLGGIGEVREDEHGERMTACRPFTAFWSDAASDTHYRDVLWPLGTVRQREERLGWRMLVLYAINDDTGDPQSRSYLWLFPLLYYGQSQEGERSAGFFPFYGVVRDVASIDQIRFVLFPLYAQTRDGETTATHVLWPFYRRATGPRDDQFRLWPFYGRQARDGIWERRFIAWPFWTQARNVKPGSEGGGWILFPLYGQASSAKGKLRMVLPPFFQYAAWEDGVRIRAPWPFVEWYHENEEFRHTFWPLYASKRIGHTSQRYLLWPFFWRTVVERQGMLETQHRAVPVLYHARREPTADARVGADASRDLMLWPLLNYRSRGERSSLQMPMLWPLQRTRAVERSWSPLWTLYSRQRAGERLETELLWGTYRHTRDPDRRHFSLFPLVSFHRDDHNEAAGWNLFCGLLGHHRVGSESSWRVLFLGGRPQAQEAEAEQVEDQDGESGL